MDIDCTLFQAFFKIILIFSQKPKLKNLKFLKMLQIYLIFSHITHITHIRKGKINIEHILINYDYSLVKYGT